MTRALSVSILMSVLSFAGHAVADEPGAAATASKVVDVVVSGDTSTVAGVEVVVRELVARLQVALEWSRTSGIDPGQVLAQRPPDPRVVARAWMDLSDPRRARIYVANAQGGRFLVRVVPLRDGYDEVAREVLGHIIESSVDAFLAGRDVGVSREIVSREIAEREVGHDSSEASAPAPLPAPVAKRGFAGRLGVALSYQVTEMAGPTMMHGPAIGIGLASQAEKSVRFSSSATAHYRLPLHWDSSSVGARFDGGTVRLAVGIDGDVTPHVVLRGQVGIGVDVLRVAPYVEAGSMARAEAPLWIVSPMASATISVEAPLSRRIGWLAGVGCDLDLSGSSYFVANGPAAKTVLSPWIVHPTGMLGLVFRVGDENDAPR